MSDVPEIRYASSGEVEIAYQVLGDGPVDVVWVAGSVTHLGVLWEHPGYRQFCKQLASFSRLILFDKRGMGLSEHTRVGTLEERMDDVRAVMDAAGSERAALVGVSEGGPLSMLFAATYPERTEALLLIGAEVKEEQTDDWPWGEGTREEFDEWVRDLPDRWGRASLRSGSFRTTPIPRTRRVVRPPADVLDDAPRRDRLSVDGNGDRRARRGAVGARADAGRPPRRRPHDRRAGGAAAGPRARDRALHGHRRLDRRATELGDRRWRSLLEAHHSAVRRQLERFRGRELDTAGDGFLASFDGPARAIRCAGAAIDAVRGLGLEIRAGVHTGECEVVGDKLAGIAVHIGARVAGKARPGEVLVSSTV